MSEPLLLMEGVEDLDAQIRHQRCERNEFDRVFCGWIDPRGSREPRGDLLPALIAQSTKVGCIEVATAPWRNYANGNPEDWSSRILFTDRAGFKTAWSIARRIKKTNPGCLAVVSNREIAEAGAFLYLGYRHPLLLDGRPTGNINRNAR